MWRTLVLLGLVALAGCTVPTPPEPLTEVPRCSDGDFSIEIVEFRSDPGLDQYSMGFRNRDSDRAIIDFVNVSFWGVETTTYGPLSLYSTVDIVGEPRRVTFGSPAGGTVTGVVLRPGRGAEFTFAGVASRNRTDIDTTLPTMVTDFEFLGVPPGGEIENFDGPNRQPLRTCRGF